MRIALLGPVQIEIDGSARPLSGVRRAAIVSALALHPGQFVAAGRLAEIVWGDPPSKAAEATLRSHVSALRRLLGDPGAVLTRSAGYRLDLGEDETDVQVARRLMDEAARCPDLRQRERSLEAAVALWRGDPLGKVAGLAWFESHAARLADLLAHAREMLIDTRLELGMHDRLIPDLEAAARQRPHHEPTHRQLMLARYRAGQQSEALAAYQRLRRALHDDLGLTPGAAVRDLELAILRQDPALTLTAAASPAPARAAAPPAREAPVAPAVRFLPTPGGQVAYTVTGTGPPLVYSLGWISHLGLMWDNPDHRRFVETLAQEYTVIRFDKLGCGLSDRHRVEFTLESELATLRALVEHLGLRRFALLGSCEGGQVAAAYAAAHPDAVSSLIVYGSCANGADMATEEVRESLLGLIRAHWGLGSRTLADIWLPGAPPWLAAGFAQLQRTAATAETAAALMEMFYRLDVTGLLPTIRVPTLVLHRQASRAIRFELARQLAALIPGARLAALPGRMHPIYAEGAEPAASMLVSFLRAHHPAEPAPAPVAGRARPARPAGRLSPREFQVADLIADGLTNAEIARSLHVSVRTVDTHVDHLRTKLGFRGRAQIAVWARHPPHLHHT